MEQTEKKTCIGCREDLSICRFSRYKKISDGTITTRARCSQCTKTLRSESINRLFADGYAKQRDKIYPIPGHRVCSSCRLVKPFCEYHKNKRGRFKIQASCIKCARARSIRLRKRSTRAQHHMSSLKGKYGIRSDEYFEMFNLQNGKCAICGTDGIRSGGGIRSKRVLGVDHCHKTGAVRGLLCVLCNAGIGKLKDSCDILSSAKRYVDHHSGAQGRLKELVVAARRVLCQ